MLAGQLLHGTGQAVDGDTIIVVGVHVRLQGVAAPEIAHPDKPKAESGGDAAADFMHRLVDGRVVVCDLTGERMHGRRIDVCEVGGRDLGAAVIEAGPARDWPRFSGGRYAGLEQRAAASLPFPSYCVPRAGRRRA